MAVFLRKQKMGWENKKQWIETFPLLTYRSLKRFSSHALQMICKQTKFKLNLNQKFELSLSKHTELCILKCVVEEC